MKKVLFIDRDGTLVIEPPIDKQLDSLEKLEFYPFVFQSLAKIVNELDYELVMVSNQDGLGTASFPEIDFHKCQDKLLTAFNNEGITFDAILIDKTFPHENAPTRKPRTGLLTKYLSGDYDLKNSFVIGDRVSDMELAHNLGAKGIFLGEREPLDNEVVVSDWKAIYEYLKLPPRVATVQRTTSETDIFIEVNLDGTGKSSIETGLGFFDHMLDQIARHASIDMKVKVKGDLHVDEHHTIEDTAIALGEVFSKALANKKGIERYGFCLPMDDCLVQVALDFGGRNWLVWDCSFHREKIGDVPTEMFFHFFKSFSDSARCNLNIKAEGENEHHKIEGVFKALAKSIKMAVKRDINSNQLPSTKGIL